MKYCISVRKIEQGKFVDRPELGATRYLRVPQGQRPSPEHQVGASQWVKNIIESLGRSTPPAHDILFVVHGRNGGIEEVDDRHKLLQTGLQENNFPCAVVSFDWPAGSSTLSDIVDRDYHKMTAFRLVKSAIKLLIQARSLPCEARVHALGHSTGVFVLREAFDHADDGRWTAANWTVGQLVIIAGDASADSFSSQHHKFDSLFRHSYRITNYSNGYDEVLQISNVNRPGLAPRVGRVGLPKEAHGKTVCVDCSSHFRESYGETEGTEEFYERSHTWYFEDATFHKDLAITLRGGVDRNLIPTRASTSKGELSLRAE
jgi:esterase/lipase superfamily enzyme